MLTFIIDSVMSNFNNEHHTYLIQCGRGVLQISLLWVLDAQVEPEGRSLGELSGSRIVDWRRWWILVVLALRPVTRRVVGCGTHFRQSSVSENGRFKLLLCGTSIREEESQSLAHCFTCKDQKNHHL